jgi:hypothetical protein
LKDNHRQRHHWEIEALRQLRDGNTSKAFHAYLDHGRITVGYDAHHTKTLLVADWWAASVGGQDALMLAGRRADVAELNLCGHVRAEAAGHLSGPMLDLAGVPIRAGDKVMTLRNDRAIGVRNGNRGVVLDVDPDEHTMRIQLARRIVDVPARYVDAGHVGLAYAMTVNKAHGTTCDATMTLADDLLYRELAYEAMSRGRRDNRVYLSRTTASELDLRLEDGPHAPLASEDDPLDVLAAALQRRHAKQLALDHITPVPIEAWSTRDLLAERGRIGSILSHAPPDRSADLEALRAAHRQAEAEVAERRQAVSELERRRRPLRERRQPDHQLTTASNRLSVSEQRAERLQHEIGAVEASQHRRASHLTTHRADRLELDLIDRQLDERLRRQINRVVKDLPSYITKALGLRPHDAAMDRVWVKTVIEIEKHRLENGITDQRTAIGPEPTDPAMLNTWRRLRWTIDETHQTLTPCVFGSDRTPTPPHRPELGISL